ncbi:MAG: hypothetical protein P8K82_09670 [Paracoccaceae bacterium]|nr:hypothetical protein [Paracoccaceae bacterium]
MNKDLETYANWKCRGVELTTDELTLKAEGSYWTGREQVWLDGEVVSKKWNYRLSSSHCFMRNGESYKVAFKMKNLFTGKVEIAAYRNDALLFSETAQVFSGKRALLIFIIAVLLGYSSGYWLARF